MDHPSSEGHHTCKLKPEISSSWPRVFYVAPHLVLGTRKKGFSFLGGLGQPFHRAAFMVPLVSEAPPFVDGNGRVARIMMNAGPATLPG